MLGIPVAMVTANAMEWVIHKYLLHGRGRDRASFWAFHWHEHHGECRRNDHIDVNYDKSVFGWNAQGKEAISLLGGGLLFLPLFPVAPFFVGTMWGWGVYYHHVHRKSHRDPDWAREHLPWHYDHHMAPNQDANWCVTKPWFDHVMGTRVPYMGTDKERTDRARRQARLKEAALKKSA